MGRASAWRASRSCPLRTRNVYTLTSLSVRYGVAFATVTSSTTALVADVRMTDAALAPVAPNIL